jgi:hypothetical protein
MKIVIYQAVDGASERKKWERPFPPSSDLVTDVYMTDESKPETLDQGKLRFDQRLVECRSLVWRSDLANLSFDVDNPDFLDVREFSISEPL